MNVKWNNAELYESYVGRWSRLLAFEFLKWLDQDKGLVWIDVGCGTGALTSAILSDKKPAKVIGIDPSQEHIEYLRKRIKDPAARFETGDAVKLLVPDGSTDVIVSGLVLNFINDIDAALKEFKRAARFGAAIGGYVWDYAGKMEMMRYFWDSAVSLFEDAAQVVEANRFRICDRDSLREVFTAAGLKNIEVTYIDIPTIFRNFDDYWNPFLSGIGPAPGYCMSLIEEDRNKLKEKIFSSLPVNKDGSIDMIARAIAVKSLNH